MAKTVVYVVSDESEGFEKVKNFCTTNGFVCNSYTPDQWKDGMDNPGFRGQLVSGLPSLASGLNPLGRSNILPFPGLTNTAPSYDSGKVSTMEEMESKAIETAIHQYRGNLTEAAKALGIGRATLYRKVKQYQIDPSMARKKRAA